MKFSHPLAREAMVWPANAGDGGVQRVLVVVTTMALDQASKNFKKEKVERLAKAAQDYVSAHPSEASAFLLMNRVKDWHAPKS